MAIPKRKLIRLYQHCVYILRSNLKARIKTLDGFDELPVYKIGYSADPLQRKLDYTVPYNLQLVDYVGFDNKETALIVERMLLEAHYTDQRLRGTRGRRHKTEWLYLKDDQLAHTLENLRQFRDPNRVKELEKDANTIRGELDNLGDQIQALKKTYGLERELPSLFITDETL